MDKCIFLFLLFDTLLLSGICRFVFVVVDAVTVFAVIVTYVSFSVFIGICYICYHRASNARYAVLL